MTTSEDISNAVEAIQSGELVVYPTETVYGLGADALNPDAIKTVYEVKSRSRDNPISLAVPTIEEALTVTSPTQREIEFMEAFLPGPVTVLVAKKDQVPNILTSGRDRVGVRIPDHDIALELLENVAPITATSANISGQGSVRQLTELDGKIKGSVAVQINGGKTPGNESTVVDISSNTIYRRGANIDAIEQWLETNST
ncbi:MAG: L-threonylcarbamoyladenylate synthase [Halobacteriaceae archaeon]